MKTPPTVKLYTEAPCPGPSCQRCRELEQVTREIVFPGARRALDSNIGPFRKSPPIQIHHQACHEVDDPARCQEALPQLHVDEEPVLAGGHWTETEVRRAVEMAIERARGSADQSSGWPGGPASVGRFNATYNLFISRSANPDPCAVRH